MSIRSLAALALTVIASSSAIAAEGSERKCGAGSCSKKGKAAHAVTTVAQEASCSKKDAAKEASCSKKDAQVAAVAAKEASCSKKEASCSKKDKPAKEASCSKKEASCSKKSGS